MFFSAGGFYIMMAGEDKKKNQYFISNTRVEPTSQKRCSLFTHHIITLQTNNITMTRVDYIYYKTEGGHNILKVEQCNIIEGQTSV